LKPLPEKYDEILSKQAKSDFKKIKDKLNRMGRKYKEDLPFQDFMTELQMTCDQYIIAIRSSLRRNTTFLKRSTNAIFLNAYNEKLLKTWKANVDVQFILDPYACAKYCVSYISKSNGGMSKLMRDVCKDVKNGNLTLKERLRKFVNVFMNSSEISAQEAAFWVLGLPLSSCSRHSIYLNTSLPEERVILVKSKDELDQLEDDSNDIAVEGIMDHYIQRPSELNSICLAEFAAMYNFSKASKSKTAIRLLDSSGYVQKRLRAKIVRFRRYSDAVDADNFYREECMLYIPWRDEQNELMSINIQQKYRDHQIQISENRRLLHFNDNSDSIEAAFEELGTGEYEDIVPNKRFEVEEDQFDIHREMKGEKPRECKVDYLLPLKQIPDDDYWTLIRALNEKQRKYFLHLVHALKLNNSVIYDFVTGGAGVGKSHLITAIVQTILRQYCKIPGICLESVFVLVCASTGKAAFNVRGVTLHCAFRLPPNQYGGNLAKLSDGVCNSMRITLRHLKLIIIDEISMTSLKHLYQIHERLKQIFLQDKLFGGIPFLVVGDFHQIRPVFAKFVFQELNDSPIQAIIGNILWELFQMFELTEVMRQKEDLDFAVALNNMAKGQMTETDITLIRSRQITNGLIPPRDAIRLFWTNVECNIYNKDYQTSLTTEECVSDAFDQIQGSGTEAEKKSLLEFAKTFTTQEADGLPLTVTLKIGATYMVSTNVDVPDGLINGSTEILKLIEYGTTGEGQRIPIRAYMEFEDPTIGCNMRAKFSGMMQKRRINHMYTPISFEKKTLTKTGVNKNLEVVRRQIPLVSANGITITKSQGSTYKTVVVKLKKNLPRDQLYVACSRSSTAEGLFLNGEFIPPGPPPQFILDELSHLRKKGFQLSLKFLQDVPDSFHKLIFHNVQSLHKHYYDIVSDIGFTSADVMAFVEPWIFQNENYDIPTFQTLHRRDCGSTRNSIGSIVFVKSNILCQPDVIFQSYSSAKGHYDFTLWTMNHVNFMMVYRSPKSNILDFQVMLEEYLISIMKNCGVIVFGDFNIDLDDPKETLKDLFFKYGLRALMPVKCASTDGGTQVDGAFSNIKVIEAWFYESIFSYHQPICITWPKSNIELIVGPALLNIAVPVKTEEIPPSCSHAATSINLKYCTSIETSEEVRNESMTDGINTLEGLNLKARNILNLLWQMVKKMDILRSKFNGFVISC